MDVSRETIAALAVTFHVKLGGSDHSAPSTRDFHDQILQITG
jgi:hypothetical protein